MTTRTLFLIFINLTALSTYTCFSMELEKEEKIITLDEGLLTVIPANMIITRYVSNGFWASSKRVEELTIIHDSIVNLFNREYHLQKIPAYFYPGIIKLTIAKPHNYIQDLGTFNKQYHPEVKEAIRERKALYYTGKQGFLIYSLSEQPNPNICTDLERMLEDKKSTMILY